MKGKYKFAHTKTTRDSSERVEYHFVTEDKAIRVDDQEQCSLSGHEMHKFIVNFLEQLNKAAVTEGFTDKSMFFLVSINIMSKWICNIAPQVIQIRKEFDDTVIDVDYSISRFDTDQKVRSSCCFRRPFRDHYRSY
jgi:hypothetical protein